MQQANPGGTATEPVEYQQAQYEARGIGAATRDALFGPVGRALLALVLLLIVGAVFDGDGAFYRFGTHRDALRQASVYGILACGLTLVIVTGGIDLSVGSVLAVTMVLFSILSIHRGYPAYVTIPACLLAGATAGAVSGVLTSWFRVQPFIATLAVMAFGRGVAKWITSGEKVSRAVRDPASGDFKYVDLPASFALIDSRVLGGNVSVVTLIFFACALGCWLLLARHRWGRQLYAIGGNEEAARLSGVPVRRAKLLAYVASGLLAGVAGLCQAAQEQQGDPEAGVGYELTAIAMVVVGGTSLAGGRGGMGLTLLGTLTIAYLDKILSINAVPEYGRQMLTGVILVVAVLAQRRRSS